ncbi:response regulator transcription factor [Paenibacillus taichungensis]|uniref:response regulator transcription factor n=1 Tax=Paenibacillus taichungensis TaxID=484184 RepID=UPI0035D9976F
MYKAALVDDENYDLVGMRELIPWDELNIEIAFMGNKPLAALHYLQNHDVDILVTDIKMPVMSGLELARMALQKQPELKIIFISGYEDFDYAKQAIHLKADGYILKPVDDDEIKTTLQKIVHVLKEENARLETNNRSDALEHFDFVKQDFLKHLMEGSIDAPTLQSFTRLYPLPPRTETAHAVIIEMDHMQHLFTDEEYERWHELTFRQITSWIETKNWGAWCRLSTDRIGLMYSYDAGDIELNLNELIHYIRDRSRFTITVSFGQKTNRVTELPVSFDEARNLIGCKMFLGKNRLISPGEVHIPLVRDVLDVNSQLDRLFTAMSTYDLVTICDAVEELFEHVRAFSDSSKVHHFSTHVLSRLEGYLNAEAQGDFPHFAKWKAEGFETVQQFDTVDDIKSWLRRTVFEWSEHIYLRKQKSNWKLFSDIEHYVGQRLSQDVTLKDLAAHFSYSPNHLGFLFKDKVGVNFSDYVAARRLEHARHLLQTTNLKIYEIADQVGYRSLTYFSRLFRETFGMKPGDFRKQS